MLTIKVGSYTQIPEHKFEIKKRKSEIFKAQGGFDGLFLSLKKGVFMCKET